MSRSPPVPLTFNPAHIRIGIIGYDNERPKGDHRHQGKARTRYRFESPEQLIGDFLRDVESRRK